MRTADSIEETKAQKTAEKSNIAGISVKKKRGPNKHHRMNPKSIEALKITQWVPGVSGNPGGRPKHDVGAQIARAVLEQNAPAAYYALTEALLKGNAYVFKELCERGFGKLKEQHEVTHRYEEVKDADLDTRINSLLADLGLAAQIDSLGRVESADGRKEKTNGKAQVADVLS